MTRVSLKTRWLHEYRDLGIVFTHPYFAGLLHVLQPLPSFTVLHYEDQMCSEVLQLFSTVSLCQGGLDSTGIPGAVAIPGVRIKLALRPPVD